jgi:hypothetical protein
MTKEEKLEYKAKAAKLSDFQKPDAGMMTLTFIISILASFLYPSFAILISLFIGSIAE